MTLWHGLRIAGFTGEPPEITEGFYNGDPDPDSFQEQNMDEEPWDRVFENDRMVIFAWDDDAEDGFFVLQAYLKEGS